MESTHDGATQVKEASPFGVKYGRSICIFRYEKHMAFHRKYPEKFSPESILAEQGTLTAQYQTLPIYFSNVCLRFLPVLDIINHRFLELAQVHKNLETILERLGVLYKFHDRPITYLYNTFHYYESKLRERPNLKRRLVVAVIMSQQEIRPPGWALTEAYKQYLGRSADDIVWNPGLPYYTALVKRLVNSILYLDRFNLRGKIFAFECSYSFFLVHVK
ncbi:mediator of RNA polymerase II transcription subunit 23-like [Macrobrachium nipponense]|uniref:mediator of RNA polymerase II transcription subunit 23-like n=1 Tax=Macrobrachium nipponense TaxID=159736 RepID=UPI0030C83502